MGHSEDVAVHKIHQNESALMDLDENFVKILILV